MDSERSQPKSAEEELAEDKRELEVVIREISELQSRLDSGEDVDASELNGKRDYAGILSDRIWEAESGQK